MRAATVTELRTEAAISHGHCCVHLIRQGILSVDRDWLGFESLETRGLTRYSESFIPGDGVLAPDGNETDNVELLSVTVILSSVMLDGGGYDIALLSLPCLVEVV